MPDTPFQPAGSTLQPFRLLDLPRELLVPIVRSYRSPLREYYSGLVIYKGEQDVERYRVLRDLCLAHRDILPFAQEELFNRLDIRSDERMYFLNQSIASSERCMEYAGRAESIFLGEVVDPDGLMQSAAFNPRELCIMSTLKFSLLNRFRNLRRIHLTKAQLDEALVLPSLETYSVLRTKRITMDTSADFKSANLPNLRRLVIYQNYAKVSVGQVYDSIIPQLDHLLLGTLPFADVKHLLVLSTSLQSLRIEDNGTNERLSQVYNQISRIDMKDLHYRRKIDRENSDDWETDFEPIQKLKTVIQGKDGLRRFELALMFHYDESPSDRVCDQALARWISIKGELESICAKKGTEVVALTCFFTDDHKDIWVA